MKTKEKEWDCVKFQREQRERLSTMFAGKTNEEILAYFRESSRTSEMRTSPSLSGIL